MKRAFALIMLVACSGCGSAPTSILGSTVTDLQAGSYSGEILCEGAITDVTGTSRFQGTLSVLRVIGESGLPVEDGLEAQQGNALDREIGGYAATVIIDTVTATTNDVVVNASGFTESEVCADSDCTSFETHSIEMITSERYEPSGQDSLEYDSSVTIYEWHDGVTIATGSFSCTGVLGP